jgi:3-phosphoshikimate 1-carboxyvinyltransferase
MFTPIAALSDRSILVTGHGSLLNRPVRALQSALQQLGVACLSLNGFPPISVKGPLRHGKVLVDGQSSSQHISGLLFALPLLQGDSEIVVTNPKSKPYIRMTLAALQTFGIHIEFDENFTSFLIPKGQRFRPSRYAVEGDWSAAAFLLVAGAIAGSVTVEHLNPVSLQADRAILHVLRECGAEVKVQEDRVQVRKGNLSCFQVDASDMPDLIPPLAVLACNCEGTSVITGSERLKEKESDRSRALVEELSSMGVEIVERNNSLEITGGPVDGGNVQTHNDHRIAMATAVAALGSRRGVVMEDHACVAKSYPRFFDDLEQLGGNR